MKIKNPFLIPKPHGYANASYRRIPIYAKADGDEGIMIETKYRLTGWLIDLNVWIDFNVICIGALPIYVDAEEFEK